MTLSETWIDFLAGWASGAVAVVACQPVDTVLTRVQAGPSLVPVVGGATAAATATSAAASATSAATSAAAASAASSTSSIHPALLQTKGLVQTHGIPALWRGSSAMISAVPFQNALLMGGYGIGKQWAAAAEAEADSGVEGSTTSTTSTSSTLVPVFIGGCTGGIVQSFFMSPVEWIKVNQQVHANKSVGAASRELFFSNHNNTTSPTSTTNTWRGLNATLLRDGIPHGVWFASYEWCKTTLTKNYGVAGGVSSSSLSSSSSSEGGGSSSSSSATEQVAIPLASGAFAATVAWAVGYPFDIIKTRIQASPQPQGIYATALQLIRESNGNVFQGLYRGFGLKLVRAVPASMVGFLTYETVAGSIRGGGGSTSE